MMSNCNCNFNRNYNSMNNMSNYNRPVFPSNYLYGHAYTPNQVMNKIFDPETGLRNGTMFPELVSPYYPGQSMDFINSLRSGGRQNG